MIVLRSPKGWTGPKVVDDVQIEGTFRAHQVPITDPAAHSGHLALIEEWLESYRAKELFDDKGRLIPELADLAPVGMRRMGANPHANGGLLLRDLRMPDFREYACKVPMPGEPKFASFGLRRVHSIKSGSVFTVSGTAAPTARASVASAAIDTGFKSSAGS